MAIPNGQQLLIELVHKGMAGEGGSNSVPVYNVYHYYRTTTVAVIDRAGVFTAWKAAIGDKVILALNERYTSQEVNIRCLNDAEQRMSSHTFSDPGAIAGESLPMQNAVSFLLRSDTRGPWAKGRKSFGPISEADVQDDCIKAASVALFTAIKTPMLAGFTDALGNVWKPTIVSKTYSQLQTNPTTINHYPITEILINKNIGSMDARRVRTVR